jgi:L-alanine-DL-glutamate epimerase-like enolase superfamily enzyme
MKITGWEVLTLPDRGDAMMLVVVDTDEGIHGIGEVGVRSRQRAVAGGLDHLGELITGADPLRTEHLWQVMFRSGFYPADRILTSAIAALDVALWDIRGKALGVPVHQLLGGPVRDHVPCYVHVGDGMNDRPRFLERCRALVAEGWRHLRFSVPHDDDVLDERRTLRLGIVPGRVLLSDLPGLGVDIDRDRARAYRAESRELPQLRKPDGSFTNW